MDDRPVRLNDILHGPEKSACECLLVFLWLRYLRQRPPQLLGLQRMPAQPTLPETVLELLGGEYSVDMNLGAISVRTAVGALEIQAHLAVPLRSAGASVVAL